MALSGFNEMKRFLTLLPLLVTNLTPPPSLTRCPCTQTLKYVNLCNSNTLTNVHLPHPKRHAVSLSGHRGSWGPCAFITCLA